MVSLRNYTTFGIEAYADRVCEVRSEEQLRQLLAEGALRDTPFLILGGGSNMVFAHDFHGTVVRMANRGVRLLRAEGDDLYVEASAGEVWDDFVRFCAAQGWHGLENLVAIPGTVGAAPVQNVGAYGMEAKDVVFEVRAYEVATGLRRTFANGQCAFGYRQSVFKGPLKGRYVVASVVFRLHKKFCADVSYRALKDALASRGIESPDPQQLLQVIGDVRWGKLPRPETMGSAGSFFKNPVVTAEQHQALLSEYPDLVAYPVEDGYKLAAGWLIERAGWKGRALGRCGVYDKQALVLVNLGGCTGQEVVALSDAVVSDVRRLFGVSLEKEAVII